MSTLTTGRAMAFERLLAEDAVMLPQYRKLGGQGIVLAKALNRPFEFERTDTAYSKTLDFLPANWKGAAIESLGGATIVDAGALVSAGVTSIVSKDADAVTLDTYAIPAEVQALMGYGWSAGTAYNEVDLVNKKYIQRVTSVDMGDLTWVAFEQETIPGRFRSFDLRGIIKLPSANRIPVNALNALYTTISINAASSSTNCFYASSTGNIFVIDPAYSDATAFTAAVSGEILYYELAEPIETDISSLLSDDNLIEVESGGTLTFTNSNQIPVPSKIEYQRRSKDNS